MTPSEYTSLAAAQAAAQKRLDTTLTGLSSGPLNTAYQDAARFAQELNSFTSGIDRSPIRAWSEQIAELTGSVAEDFKGITASITGTLGSHAEEIALSSLRASLDEALAPSLAMKDFFRDVADQSAARLVMTNLDAKTALGDSLQSVLKAGHRITASESLASSLQSITEAIRPSAEYAEQVRALADYPERSWNFPTLPTPTTWALPETVMPVLPPVPRSRVDPEMGRLRKKVKRLEVENAALRADHEIASAALQAENARLRARLQELQWRNRFDQIGNTEELPPVDPPWGDQLFGDS